MKINLSNKMWMCIIALLFLIISLSSCSAVEYWSNPDAEFPIMGEYDAGQEWGFFRVLNLILWNMALVGGVFHIFFSAIGDSQSDSHAIRINEKWHYINNPEKAKAKNLRVDIALTFILYLSILILLIKGLLLFFEKMNVLILIIIGLIYIVIAYMSLCRYRIIEYIGIVKCFSWKYVIVDFVVGTIIFLWKLSI